MQLPLLYKGICLAYYLAADCGLVVICIDENGVNISCKDITSVTGTC